MFGRMHALILALAAGIFVHSTALTKAEEVYMIRGFMNVFSDGMNQMTRQLNARGIRAKVISNGAWQEIANDIIRRSKSKKVSSWTKLLV